MCIPQNEWPRWLQRDGRRAGRTREPPGSAKPSVGAPVPAQVGRLGRRPYLAAVARLRAEEQAVAGARIGAGDAAQVVASTDDRDQRAVRGSEQGLLVESGHHLRVLADCRIRPVADLSVAQRVAAVVREEHAALPVVATHGRSPHGEHQSAARQGDAGSDELLGEEGAGGLYHIGAYLVVDQYDAAYRYLEGIGYQQIQGGPILGIDRVDYFEADARLGLTMELLDMPEVYGTPEYEYP